MVAPEWETDTNAYQLILYSFKGRVSVCLSVTDVMYFPSVALSVRVLWQWCCHTVSLYCCHTTVSLARISYLQCTEPNTEQLWVLPTSEFIPHYCSVNYIHRPGSKTEAKKGLDLTHITLTLSTMLSPIWCNVCSLCNGVCIHCLAVVEALWRPTGN